MDIPSEDSTSAGQKAGLLIQLSLNEQMYKRSKISLKRHDLVRQKLSEQLTAFSE